MEPKILYRLSVEYVPAGAYELPLDKAEVVRQGTELTVVSYRTTLYTCKLALAMLRNPPAKIAHLVPPELRNISVDLIDLRTINGGVGAKLAARILEKCFTRLKAPVKRPLQIYVKDNAKLTLHGLQQHFVKIDKAAKNRKLNDLLDTLEFNQVGCIFVKSISCAMQLDQLLRDCNFPLIAIHSGLGQEEQIDRYKQFKAFKKRILVATNIFGRGINVEQVNIVINYNTPEEADLYLHCVGRAGRFGTKGLAITFVSSKGNQTVLDAIQSRFEVAITKLPDHIEASLYMNA
ncbi:hypothetical protein PCASD_15913 [Puccinia coronata f. sp. avenae]|uniref:RNA helicase n=1 Tax=Puccinia coronata f. sp. avenae TaxID=200324 RepID=A0A2N5UEX8_9BASI|nr:hypothetical protein PCASD_15913 [Puccinia coronata f. sp. avenae]